MGRVRNKMVKRASRQVIERHYPKMTTDFHSNKRVLDEVAEVPSKRVRNQVAGYASKLMRRIQRGPVRGISLKLQEEERERRLDFLPERSFADKEVVEIDSTTFGLIKKLNLNLDKEIRVPAAYGKKRNHKKRVQRK